MQHLSVKIGSEDALIFKLAVACIQYLVVKNNYLTDYTTLWSIRVSSYTTIPVR